MKWEKKGLVFVNRGNHDWNVSHAQLPTLDRISDDVLRIYYGTRDKSNRTVITYIEVEAGNPQNILHVHDSPVLGLGELGCFDDSGVIPSWIVNHGGSKYLYYVGSNPGVSVPYRNSLGLAISEDNGQTFTRLYKGPIVDRTKSEPQFIGAACVRIENDLWRMWYLATLRWVVVDSKPEPVYHLRYAESRDGVNWDRQGIVSIDLRSPDEGGVSRPCVVHEDGIYRMWYSYRGIRDYRTNKAHSYRIGYAESKDGIKWERMDDTVGIDVSAEGWDSVMVTYAVVYEHKGKKYMIYNGNGFGKSGFGYATLG